MKKFLDAIQNILIGIAIIYFALVLIGLSKRDVTDTPDGSRSGMILRTDHGTGCQYLQSPLGFTITPRLDATGKPMCGRVSQ